VTAVVLDLALRLLAFIYLVFQFLLVGVALLPAVLFVRVFWIRGSLPLLALAFGVAYLIFGLTYLVLVLIVKWLVLGRIREGEHPFVSPYAIRWAFVGSLVNLAKILILQYLLGMPILNTFFRLMGMRIGRNVVINTCNLFDYDLIEIGDDSFLGGDAVVIGHAGEGGRLKLRPVRIGKGCTVGQSSVVFPGATMEDRSVLGALSLLPKGRTLPAGTVWGGNPLQEIRRSAPE
jgi:non-ribosomal peptide synthetase-like protein